MWLISLVSVFRLKPEDTSNFQTDITMANNTNTNNTNNTHDTNDNHNNRTCTDCLYISLILLFLSMGTFIGAYGLYKAFFRDCLK